MQAPMTAIFRTKSIEQSKRDAAGDTGDVGGESLKKNLSAFDLIIFGVGVVVGTGIFVLTGLQAHVNAGPGIVISFVLAAVACGLAALCYAEVASKIPISGSAYSYAYATFGEVVA